MKTLADITVVTYSNSNCADVWPMYLGQLQKHAGSLQHHLFADGGDVPAFGLMTLYNSDDPYYLQWTKCLKNVNTDYVIYMQEDFVLYDDVDYAALQRYVNFLESSDYSFVRLIRANFDMSSRPIRDDLFEVNQSNEDIFHMQATLWKKSDIEKLYLEAKSVKWLEAPHWRDAARKLDIRGAFAYNGERFRGKYHCDSAVFPYICTAVSRGKWNMNEYGAELTPLLEKYSIDPQVRGARKDYNYGK